MSFWKSPLLWGSWLPGCARSWTLVPPQPRMCLNFHPEPPKFAADAPAAIVLGWVIDQARVRTNLPFLSR